ncbi:UNVERIFIED_CONTAM: putative ribonuclease H protein [Sesamum latifolium]|uniref:Ribonuclease H protein n=1 Tax=Sesamum latifolium TaxID=2727402 RepID=A0AAW2TVG8_9LAMI
MSIFLWRLLNNKIPVDQRIQSKGIQLASKCTCCNCIETINHVFLDGPEISKVWEFFARKFSVNLPSTNNIILFLSYWRFSSIGKNHIRTILPMLILWFCWLERNDSKHRGQKFKHERIIWKVHQFINTISRTKHASLVNWRDGASKGNPGPAGAGGIARNDKGEVIFAFYDFIREATNMYAEVYGLFKTLQVCQAENFNRIWIEVDAINLIRLIKEPTKGHWSLQHMLSHINLFLKRMEFRISHIYREGNKAADHLANLACSIKSTKVFRGDELHGHITGIIKCDSLEIPYIRTR